MHLVRYLKRLPLGVFIFFFNVVAGLTLPPVIGAICALVGPRVYRSTKQEVPDLKPWEAVMACSEMTLAPLYGYLFLAPMHAWAFIAHECEHCVNE